MFRSTYYSRAPRIVALIAAGALALAGLAVAEQGSAQPAHAAGAVAYDSIPDYTAPDSWPSLGLNATSTHEFGDLIQLGSTAGAVTTVKVGLVSWACETGAWETGDCASSAGATFTAPVTVSIYAVGASTAVGATPGARITSVTSTVTAPYRPSTDPACTGGKYKSAGGDCVNGEIFIAPFTLPSPVTLPSQVIVTVAFPTTNYDGIAAGPYNALNVAAIGTAPTIGSNPAADLVYLQSKWAGAYTDQSFPVNTLHADNGWTGNDIIPLELDSVVPVLGEPAPPAPALPTTEVPAPTPSTTGANGQPLVAPTTEDTAANPPAPGDKIDVAFPAGTFIPYEWVFFAFYSIPADAGGVQAAADGSLTASVAVPASVPGGSHTLAATGSVSGIISTAAVTIADPPGLAATGVDAGQVWELGMIGAAAILAGLAAAFAAMARRRSIR